MRPRVRNLSWAGLMTLVGTLAFLLSACSGNSVTDKLAADQTLHYFYSAETNNDLDSFDPAHTQYTQDAELAGLIFPQLVTQDANLNVVPWAATKMPDISSDGKTYTFHLRSGMKWSDGTTIDANTFAYSINRSASPCVASEVEYYATPIKDADTFNAETCDTDGKTITGPIQTLIGDSISVPDALTLAITLSRPSSYFLADFTNPIFFGQPKQLIDQFGEAWTDHLASQSGGFGGGPFKIVKWDHNGNLQLDANSTFFGGTPKLKHIAITIYKDSESAYNDYLAGKLDTTVLTPAHLASAKSRSDYFHTTTLTTFYLFVNWALKPFDDVRVRQAFALALDKQEINNKVYAGQEVPTNHIVPPGIPGYNADLKGPDGTQNLTGNPKQAKALIQQYVADKLGGDATKFPAVTYTYRSNSAGQANLAQALQKLWQQNLGITITLQTMTSGQILHGEKNLQLHFAGWQDEYPYPQDFLSNFFEPGAPYATAGVDDAATAQLLNDADQQSDQDKARQEYQTAEQNMVTEVGWIPLFHEQEAYLLKPYVAGYKLDPSGQNAFTDWSNVRILQHS